ncbi:MAG: hypothetical protein ABIR47_14665 [Candidatus Kapaibacterium sp.]
MLLQQPEPPQRQERFQQPELLPQPEQLQRLELPPQPERFQRLELLPQPERFQRPEQLQRSERFQVLPRPEPPRQPNRTPAWREILLPLLPAEKANSQLAHQLLLEAQMPRPWWPQAGSLPLRDTSKSSCSAPPSQSYSLRWTRRCFQVPS